MRQKSVPVKEPGDSIAELCRREGIVQNLYSRREVSPRRTTDVLHNLFRAPRSPSSTMRILSSVLLSG